MDSNDSLKAVAQSAQAMNSKRQSQMPIRGRGSGQDGSRIMEPNHQHSRSTMQKISVRGKRRRSSSRETSRGRDDIAKRPRPTNPSGNNNLCYDCARMSWAAVTEWIDFKGRVDWRGKPIADVGKRFRNVPPTTTCPLCRQLSAPWIGPFVKSREAKQMDLGDRIHIFRHLRHLPHVNDYPTSRAVLREHNAPFHIAVVPTVRGWREELMTHFAKNGLVLVIPKGYPCSDLFVPQPVPERFDPQAVLPLVKSCKRHKHLCNPDVPDVAGLKVIDCHSKELFVRKHYPGDRYVALSYVWGEPASTPSSGPQAKKPMDTDHKGHKKGERQTPTGQSTQATNRPKLTPIYNQATPQRRPIGAVKARQRLAVSRGKPRPRLPSNVPLTIRDAIQVTKALGYRFLWVDKYCIDQNNEEEKQQQFSRMGDIYAGSDMTIFALGNDPSYGLPGVSTRLRRRRRGCTTIGQYRFISTMPDPHVCIKQSRWSTRAWTYQEGLFSTRRLFFTDYQFYFECNAMNSSESMKSNLKVLHTRDGQRFRAYHRAGKFVCGNSNSYSHLKVNQNKANHRKIDIIRGCQHNIRQYSKRKLTKQDDVLNAFAGVARFYAKSSAQIANLAGIPIPFPFAKLRDIRPEGLDHLSYALAWTHHLRNFGGSKLEFSSYEQRLTREYLPWNPFESPLVQRREGFPSWSWTGWLGEVGKRIDYPHCWTSSLSSVKIQFQGGDFKEFAWLQSFWRYQHYLIRKLLTATALHFDALVLNPERLKFWDKDPENLSVRFPSAALHVNLSIESFSFEDFRQKVKEGTLECLVLGTHGQPRREIIRAIRAADRKTTNARLRRIDLLKFIEPDSIVCLIVQTVKGISERKGLLKIDLGDSDRDEALEACTFKSRRSFVLV